jgi:hypothetical protein
MPDALWAGILAGTSCWPQPVRYCTDGSPDRLTAATRAIGSVIILGFAARLLLSA